jgi:GxxExxY protein
MTEEYAKDMCDMIRQIAYDLHVYLGTGYLKQVYENGLANRLKKAGLSVQQKTPFMVRDEDGSIIGEHSIDILVNGELIVEVVASDSVSRYIPRVLGYMKAGNKRHGVIINFASYKFEMRKLMS